MSDLSEYSEFQADDTRAGSSHFREWNVSIVEDVGVVKYGGWVGTWLLLR